MFAVTFEGAVAEDWHPTTAASIATGVNINPRRIELNCETSLISPPMKYISDSPRPRDEFQAQRTEGSRVEPGRLRAG
jgi:hypothetical protein